MVAGDAVFHNLVGVTVVMVVLEEFDIDGCGDGDEGVGGD